MVERLHGAGTPVETVVRDLAAAPLPHLELASLPPEHPLAASVQRESGAPTPMQSESQAVLREFLDAEGLNAGPDHRASAIERAVAAAREVRAA